MPKPPDDNKPKKPKDPARPTRAKAARPEMKPLAPALADLLNPAINRGDAGVGSQTGLTPDHAADQPRTPSPSSFPSPLAGEGQGGG